MKTNLFCLLLGVALFGIFTVARPSAVTAAENPPVNVKKNGMDDPDTEAAKRRFAAGSEHYLAGRYAEACLEFEAARRIKPLADFDYNLGRCYDRQEKYPEAIEAYGRFIGGAKPSDVDLQEAHTRVKILGERVSTLFVVGAPAGATVEIESLTISKSGTLPFKAVVLSGDYTIHVKRHGFVPYHEVVSLAGGRERKLEVELIGISGVLNIVGPKGAKVFVDGKNVGTSPLMVDVAPGKRAIVVRQGAAEFKAEVVAGAGETHQIEPKFDLPPTQVAARPATTTAPLPVALEAERSWSLRVPAIVAGVLGGVFLGSGAGLLAAANGQYNSLEAQCAPACNPNEWQGAKLQADLGYAAIGIGGAAGVTGVVLGILEARRNRQQHNQGVVSVGLTDNGIVVKGGW